MVLSSVLSSGMKKSMSTSKSVMKVAKAKANQGGVMSDASAKDKVRKITKAKNAKEEKSLMEKVKKGVNISLYAGNKNPKKSVQGTGFGSAEKARESIKICERDCRDLVHQKQVIVTMFNRAKFHPHRSEGMTAAMKVFAPWLKKHGMKAEM